MAVLRDQQTIHVPLLRNRKYYANKFRQNIHVNHVSSLGEGETLGEFFNQTGGGGGGAKPYGGIF